MNEQILYKGKVISYSVKKSYKAKYARITISNGGAVGLVVPYFAPISWAKQFLEQKADWISKKIEEKSLPENNNLIPAKFSASDYLKYKLQALELVTAKIEKINKLYNFSFKNIAIKNQQTVWGSCSSNKNLNFSVKLLFLPDRLVDYVVVHELCHLKELNHSKNFWQLVESFLPDYKELRQKLKRYY